MTVGPGSSRDEAGEPQLPWRRDDAGFDAVHQALFGEPAATRKLGRYTLLERLGAGGMGVVYAAYDTQLDRKIAIKLVRSDVASSLEYAARIRREAKVMARLSHPNVVQVYEVGELL